MDLIAKIDILVLLDTVSLNKMHITNYLTVPGAIGTLCLQGFICSKKTYEKVICGIIAAFLSPFIAANFVYAKIFDRDLP